MSWGEISDDLFEAIARRLGWRQLKSLHLVNRRFHALVNVQAQSVTPKHFCFNIPRVFTSAMDLDLSHCWNQVNDTRLTALCKIYSRTPTAPWRRLNLSKCHAVTNKGIDAVSQYLLDLEDLNLNGCRSPVPSSYIGYTGVNGATLHRLQKLKKLHVRWTSITDDSFKEIAQLTNLTDLDLGECHGISEAGIESLSAFHKMENLNLERTMVSQKNAWVLSEMKSLSTLSLRNCSDVDDAVIGLLTQLPHLKELNLAKLNNITDEGVAQLMLLPELQTLDLTYCARLSGTWIQGCFMEERNWHLNKLNLTDCCNWVTDSFLEQVSTRMPNLHDLILQNCVSISQFGLTKLRACPLRCLDLSLCYSSSLYSLKISMQVSCGTVGVADSELEVVCGMNNLEYLNLAFCSSVTDVGLDKLCRLSNLSELILNCCTRITADGIRSLKQSRRKLRRLEISACHGVDTDVLFFISNWLEQIEIFNVSWLAINDTQFRSLKNLKNLTQVEIRGCHELTQEMLKEFWYVDGISDTQIIG